MWLIQVFKIFTLINFNCFILITINFFKVFGVWNCSTLTYVNLKKVHKSMKGNWGISTTTYWTPLFLTQQLQQCIFVYATAAGPRRTASRAIVCLLTDQLISRAQPKYWHMMIRYFEIECGCFVVIRFWLFIFEKMWSMQEIELSVTPVGKFISGFKS